jgi:hypothetical protein
MRGPFATWSRDGAFNVPGTAQIIRWEIRVRGWHAATFYRIDTTSALAPNDVTRSYWASFAQDLCFGITIPWSRSGEAQ